MHEVGKFPAKKTLSHVLGVNQAPAAGPNQTAEGPGAQFWNSNPGVCHVPARAPLSARSARGPLLQAADAQFRIERLGRAEVGQAPSGAAQITSWVERELQILGQHGPVPAQDRLKVLGEAFGRSQELLPEYRPLFYSYQREMDDFVEKLQEQLRDQLNAEGRLKAIKMESINFVGESTLRFQEEVKSLRNRLDECENTRDVLREQKASMETKFDEMKTRSDRDRWLAEESHKQNMDILSNLERMEKQVEALRKQERENYAELAKLQHQVKDQDQRNKMVEAQLNAERLKNSNMVPREEHEAAKEETRLARQRCVELEEMYATKEKDYQNIVDAYKQVSGHDTGVEVRPLTPRPMWTHCRGLLDPEGPRSMQQSDLLQDLVVRISAASRTLLAAYGLQSATLKSSLFGKFAKHPLTSPLVPEVAHTDRQKTPQGEDKDEPMLVRRNSFSQATGGLERSCEGFKDEDKWLPADMEASTPMPLRHPDKMRNQRFSRKKTLDFLERVLQQRLREGDQMLCRPFLETMMEQLNQEMGEEAPSFAINILASCRRHAAEPDFLGFLLLLLGHVADIVVRDNRTLCAEMLRIFRTHFESDGSTRVSKEKFFKALREVLPHKERDQCQELVTYFPPGGPATIVNYEWLLLDDPYVLSPIVYALRLQHLEESMSLSERMEKAVKACGVVVKFEQIEAACKDDAGLSSLQPEDFARAFQTQLEDLGPGVESKSAEFLELLKNCGIFHELFFPALPEEEKEGEEDDPVTGDMQDA